MEEYILDKQKYTYYVLGNIGENIKSANSFPTDGLIKIEYNDRVSESDKSLISPEFIDAIGKSDDGYTTLTYNRKLSGEEIKKLTQRRYIYCMIDTLIDIFNDEYPRDGLVGVNTFEYMMDAPDELFNELVFKYGYSKPSYTKFTYSRELTDEEATKYGFVRFR